MAMRKKVHKFQVIFSIVAILVEVATFIILIKVNPNKGKRNTLKEVKIMDRKKNSFTSNLLGILFLIWLIGSFGAFFYLAKRDASKVWSLILFGQYFFVGGIIGIGKTLSKKSFPFLLFIFPLAGIALIYSGVYMLTANEMQINKYVHVVVPFLFASAFSIVGILFIATSLQSYYRIKKYYTIELDAQCKEIVTLPGVDEPDTYMPIYEVSYCGKTYTLQNDVYTNIGRWVLGEYYTIKVNPNDIHEFVDGNEKTSNKFHVVFGIIAIFVGVATFIIILN